MNTQQYDNVVIAALKKEGGQYLDDHRPQGTQLGTTNVVGRFVVNNEEHVVLLSDGLAFCLNPLELDKDGFVHLSRWSVGGTINAREGLEKAVELFNARNKECEWDCGEITEIIRF